MTTKNVYQRINHVMHKVKYVQRSEAHGLKYSFASHDAVSAALHDAVAEAGLVILPEIESYGKEDGTYVMHLKTSIINIDQPEDRVVMKYAVPSETRNGISEKSFGTTYSYACKYSLLKAFMLETGEDADEETLSSSQIGTIKSLIDGDSELETKMFAKYQTQSLSGIPSYRYQELVDGINRYKALKKEKLNATN